MKKFTTIVMTMVFTILATSLIQAEKISNGSCGPHRHLHTQQARCRTDKNWKTKCTPPKTTCRWDKGYKPKKSKKKARKLAHQKKNYSLTNRSDFTSNHEVNENEMIMGGHQNSYGPQTFVPAKLFNNDGLVGNYFSYSNIATIHDPSGYSNESYTFTDVRSLPGNVRPLGLTFIGSLKDPNFIPSGIYCSGCSTGTTNLFGSLVINDQTTN